MSSSVAIGVRPATGIKRVDFDADVFRDGTPEEIRDEMIRVLDQINVGYAEQDLVNKEINGSALFNAQPGPSVAFPVVEDPGAVGRLFFFSDPDQSIPDQLWLGIRSFPFTGDPSSIVLTQVDIAIPTVKTVVPPYTVTFSDNGVLVDGPGTITLPASVDFQLKRLVIKRIDSGAGVIIDADGADLIDGAATINLNQQFDVVEMVPDRTIQPGWWIL